MKARRVVVTGSGAVTPLGHTREATWQGLLSGVSGVAPITAFDASTFPTRIAGEVKGFDFDGMRAADPRLEYAHRGTFFAVRAAEEAFQDSGLEDQSSERLGLYFGAGDSGNDSEGFFRTLAASLATDSGDIDKEKYIEAARIHMSAGKELEAQPFMTATHLVRRFGILGPVSNCLTACAASSQAIGEAYWQIRRGDADVMVSGGAHSMLYPLGVSGFSMLTALSTRNEAPEKASRPFDKNRDGFVMAEGACVLILEEREHALKRGAKIYGEIVGYGSTADAYRLTDMDPEGSGGARAVELAMAGGGLSAESVDYVSAHGTSTQVNDMIETRVLKKVLGEHAYKVPVSSIKSMLGHTIAAAGAIELMVCLLAIRDAKIPPTINYEEQDEQCDLDYVPNQFREHVVKTALSNSFGFGGQNICLAVRKDG